MQTSSLLQHEPRTLQAYPDLTLISCWITCACTPIFWCMPCWYDLIERMLTWKKIHSFFFNFWPSSFFMWGILRDLLPWPEVSCHELGMCMSSSVQCTCLLVMHVSTIREANCGVFHCQQWKSGDCQRCAISWHKPDTESLISIPSWNLPWVYFEECFIHEFGMRGHISLLTWPVIRQFLTSGAVSPVKHWTVSLIPFD